MPAQSGSTIPIQPVPVITFISRLKGVTAIGRRWDAGDTRRCRLCPQCTADHAASGCLVTTEDPVSNDDAPLYSFDDWGSAPSPAGGVRRTTAAVPALFRPEAAAGG